MIIYIYYHVRLSHILYDLNVCFFLIFQIPVIFKMFDIAYTLGKKTLLLLVLNNTLLHYYHYYYLLTQSIELVL